MGVQEIAARIIGVEKKLTFALNELKLQLRLNRSVNNGLLLTSMQEIAAEVQTVGRSVEAPICALGSDSTMICALGSDSACSLPSDSARYRD